MNNDNFNELDNLSTDEELVIARDTAATVAALKA